MENSIFVVMCYELDYENALLVKQNLQELGIEESDIHIIIGDNHKKIGKTVSYTLHQNFVNKVIPFVLEQKKNFYYVEANTIIFENPRYFPKYEPIHWLGFIHKWNHYIVGSHLVYFDFEKFKEMIRYINKLYIQHLDRLFKNLGEKYGMEIDKTITQIRPHFSNNKQKIRKNTQYQINRNFYLP
tara:strand:+ start:3370 stop:3924 length:555 start_codon:yes stop_codon:yes gene_type:complete